MIVALLVAAAQLPAPAFAPPLDRAIEVTSEAERTENGVPRRFTSVRRVRFVATDDGFRVEVTMASAGAADAETDPAGLFRAGFARLAGRTIVLRLDRAGKVTAIEDEDAVWQAVVDGMRALAPPGSDAESVRGAARVRAISDAIAAQPAPARRAMLASLVAPLIAPELVAEARAGEAPPRAVTVPASSAYGKAELAGLRVVRTRPNGVEVSVSATGDVAIAAPQGPGTARMTYESLRRVDPASGLVLESREHAQTFAPDGTLASERRTTTRLALHGIQIPVE